MAGCNSRPTLFFYSVHDMDKVAWLVAGNKGGVGKSVISKSMADWLRANEVAMTVVDGDSRTPDVHAAFEEIVPSHKFDLNEENGWADLSDFLCNEALSGHIVVNLPDGISDRAIVHFQRLDRLAKSYDFQVKVLFVLNTLPDGLHLFKTLTESFSEVYPVKNLHFGSVTSFNHFDAVAQHDFDDKTILFPKMNPGVMMVVRESKLSFTQFLKQSDDSNTNFIYAKLVVSDWRDAMYEALAEVLEGE